MYDLIKIESLNTINNQNLNCPIENFTKTVHYKMLNESMKNYLNTPKIEGDSMFYQQNEVNKVTTLPNYQSKSKKIKKCDKFYPCKLGKCFPNSAPISYPPMRHRPVFAARALTHNEIFLPGRENLRKIYTFKLHRKPNLE
ncbi:hypothetical protein PVAND_006386 [Polypedilum vanderplanki]|uniref:Uncharacterized protein n=1 Tax=Polypedilum vanderplanki TaxID=319348 RepID=A0A9J6C3H3_POLVA|nr:hypothetical protein PVAND_006386 [Polypedilum vanderplanki]